MTQTSVSPLVFDRSAWEAHHTALWGNNAPSDLLTVISSTRPGPNERFKPRAKIPANDVAKLWAVMEREASLDANVYFSVPAYDQAVLEEAGRGKKAQVRLLPALFVDLDVRQGEHAAGDANPSWDEADAWLADAPTPTILIRTGGGYHAYWAFNTPVDPREPEVLDLLARHKAWWTARAQQDGLSIDKGVLADIARVLRPAGTLRKKSDSRNIVTIEQNSGVRYDIEDLAAFYPEVEQSVRREKVAKRERTANGPAVDPADDNRPGTRFALWHPADQFLEDVLEAEIRGTGFALPTADGGVHDSESGRIYEDADAPTKVTFFSTYIQELFGFEDNDHSLTSFDLLALLVRGYPAAARLVTRWESNGTWPAEFTDVIRLNMDPRFVEEFALELPAQAPEAPERAVVVIPPITPETSAVTPNAGDDEDDDDEEEGDYTKLMGFAEEAVALAANKDVTSVRYQLENLVKGSMIPLSHGVAVHIYTGKNQDRFGLYKSRKDEDGKWTYDQITDWIAWRPSVIRQQVIDASGRAIEITNEHSVQIIRKDGRTRTVDGFTDEKSMSAKAVHNRLDFGVALPTSSTDKDHVSNMLATLCFDEKDALETYTNLGWYHDTDRKQHVYLAPAGSVTAAGATHDYDVAAPAGSDDGALNDAAVTIGYDYVPDRNDIRGVAEAIPAFTRIFPRRRDVSTALLGLAFISPLMLPARTSCFLVAQPEIGKSQAATAVQAFFSPVLDAKNFTGGSLLSDTTVAVSVKASWLRHCLGIWDDFKDTGDAQANQRVRQNAVTGINVAYGQSGGAGGTRSGGLRTARRAETTSLLTGEGMPKGHGFLSRTIPLELQAGDVALTPVGTSPFDVFIRDHSEDARALFGAYLQWIAAKLDQDGITAFKANNDKLKKDWQQRSIGRATELGAILATGWARFRQFAIEMGFEDLLPSAAVVDEQLLELVQASANNVISATPAKEVIAAVRDALQSAEGYLIRADEAAPTFAEAAQMGWKQTIRDGVIQYVPGNSQMGVLSVDGQWVCIINDAQKRVAKKIALDGVPADQMTRDAQTVVKEDTVAGNRSPKNLFPTRPRGWVIPAHMLDIGDAPAAVREVPPAISDAEPEPIHVAEPVPTNAHVTGVQTDISALLGRLATAN
ncbi:hypothetical protein [Leifsonia sp. fls2-241-R2A-40a]|uniref:hypothetical protein n=1 Tax=Leifsonia sp. fls2-241-R2A-40a TaxID=3040290 RepID=UPI00254ACD48|nr:hypothetical protein [Leifsonia sp. fls2-241-R2A-40a]